MYKLGDKVNYRVVVLDAEMKPYKYQTMKLGITDGERKGVHSKSFGFTDQGFVEGSLLLADELNVGKWGIHVKVDEGDLQKLNFEVKDYSLPNFEVFMEPSAKHFLLTQRELKVKVFAKYTSGSGQMPAKGKATLTAITFDPNDPEKQLNSITKPLNDWNNEISLNLRNDLKIRDNLDEVLVNLNATFEEERTSVSLSTQSTVTVHKAQTEKVEIIPENDFLTPNTPYTIKVEVRDYDGSLLREIKPIEFKAHQQTAADRVTTDTKANMKWNKLQGKRSQLQDGVANFTINVPADVSNIAIGVVYDGVVHVHKAFRLPTKSRAGINLKVASKRYACFSSNFTHGSMFFFK
jgi:hypothetical protein